MPDEDAKAQGVQLGEKVAARNASGSQQGRWQFPDTYRPHAAAGAYVPTVTPAGAHWGLVKPLR